MMNKQGLIGIAGMFVGGVLVIVGLLNIPVMSVVLIVLGGAVGFTGHYFYDHKNTEYKDLNFG